MQEKNFKKPIVFINYRRNDTIADAGRLAGDLENEFGKGFTFLDVNSIKSGKWTEKIKEAGNDAKIVLAVIGERWLAKKEGKVRLFEEEDWVRQELEAAIEGEKYIIPVLIDHTPLPQAHQLPKDLSALLAHNAISIRRANWENDIKPLIEEISKVTGISTISKRRAIADKKKREREEVLLEKQRKNRNYLLSALGIFSLFFLLMIMGQRYGYIDFNSNHKEVSSGEKEKLTKPSIPNGGGNDIIEPITNISSEIPSVKIGNQTWMTENLAIDVEGSFCYDNKPENCEKYGRLYTWEAAKKACPKGWHLPTDKEWRTLLDNYGGAGKKSYQALIEVDSSNFTALLGGLRNINGGFNNLGKSGNYWSATEDDSGLAFNYYFHSGHGEVFLLDGDDKSWGFSCRCLQN